MTNGNGPLGTRDIARLLGSMPGVLRALLTQLPERATAWHPAPGKWCIKEIVGHLTEEDKGDFAGRMRVMLERDEPALTVTDQDEAARMRHDCTKDLEHLLDEFSRARAAGVDLVLNLKESELLRSGIHPKIGRIRVSELLHEWIYHDLNHIGQIKANVQRLLWDRLGNMQQFYDRQ